MMFAMDILASISDNDFLSGSRALTITGSGVIVNSEMSASTISS